MSQGYRVQKRRDPERAREERIAAARRRKAIALANFLQLFGATADQVERMDGDGRRAAEQLAEVNESSDATWALVVSSLRAREGRKPPAADADVLDLTNRLRARAS